MFYDVKPNYLGNLPERLQNVVEFSAIAEAVDSEMDNLNSTIEKMAENRSILTSDTQGILRWEKMLGVSAPLNSTLKARKEALMARLMTKPPINLKVLRGIIEAYMGIEVAILIDGCSVRVRYRGESRIKDLVPLYVTICNTIPANMLPDIAYNYVIWSELDGLTMDFDSLDAIATNWNDFERGEWI